MNGSLAARKHSRSLRIEQLETRQMLALADALTALLAAETTLSTDNAFPVIEQPYFPEEESGAESGTSAIQSQNDMWLVINGDGFFTVQDGSNARFTRNGNFEVNELGQLTTKEGLPVLGYGVNDNFEIVTDVLVPLWIPHDLYAAHETTRVELRGVLNPSADDDHSTSTNFAIYDSEGEEISLKLRATVQAKYADSTEFGWELFLLGSSGTEERIDQGSLVFDPNGDLASEFPAYIYHPIASDPNGGIAFEIDFSEVKALGETDAQGNPISSLHARQHGGFPPGVLEDFIITNDGIINGQFTNGQQGPLGQIVLATFANPHGLKKVAPELYDADIESGEPITGAPGGVSTVIALPELYLISSEGQIYREGDPLAPRTETLMPTHPRYPWLVRSVNLKVQGRGLFILEGEDGKRLYTRDGRFRLNNQHELVTHNGLRVLGFSSTGSGIDSSQLAPIEIPLAISRRAQQTSTVEFGGNLFPGSDLATQPGILESISLGDGTIEAPKTKGTLVEKFDPNSQELDLSAAPSVPHLSFSLLAYYITFYDPTTGIESRPTRLTSFLGLSSGEQVRILGLPESQSANPMSIRIYRNVGSISRQLYRIAEVPPGTDSFVDTFEELETENLPKLDWTGAKAIESTRLVDVLVGQRGLYIAPFSEGRLTIEAKKGDVALPVKELSITEHTTVLDLLQFLEDALAIESDQLTIGQGSVEIVDGRIQIVSNLGAENQLSIEQDGLKLAREGLLVPRALPALFLSTQQADGQGTQSEGIVYDRVGLPIEFQMTTYLETRTSTSTTYRWFVSSSESGSPSSEQSNSLGTGLIRFDSQGNILQGATAQVFVPSVLGEEIPVTLDFSAIKNESVTDVFGNPLSYVHFLTQDGFPPGILERFSISDTGVIEGEYSSGLSFTLGQLQLARFRRSFWLRPIGNGNFVATRRSGPPKIASAGDQGVGEIVNLPDSKEDRIPDKESERVPIGLGSQTPRPHLRRIHRNLDAAFESLSIRWRELRSRRSR